MYLKFVNLISQVNVKIYKLGPPNKVIYIQTRKMLNGCMITMKDRNIARTVSRLAVRLFISYNRCTS